MSTPPPPASPAQPPSGPRPWSLVAAAAVVAVEAVSLLALGGYVVVEGVVGEPASWVYVVWIAAMTLGAGVALLFVGRGLLAAGRWSRAPALLTQLLAIAVAYEPLRALPAVRWPLLAVAGVTIALLFVGPTNAALRE